MCDIISFNDFLPSVIFERIREEIQRIGVCFN